MKRSIVLLVSLALCSPVLATGGKDKKHPQPGPPTVIHESDSDGAALGALVGAGIVWWVMRRRAKRQRPVPAPIAAPPTCDCPVPTTTPNTCEPVVERIFEACVAK